MSIIDLGKTAIAEGPSSIKWNEASFLEVVFWVRFLAAIVAGWACGVSGVTGASMLFAYGGLSAMSVLTITQRTGMPKGVSVDQGDLLKEGLFESVMAFIFFWTLSTTMVAA